MLTSLYIRDFALIDELEIPFGPGLNVITGQTGAGKSILIGALNMVLGGRADTEVIRTGAQKAVAEASFAVVPSAGLEERLMQYGIEHEGTLLLRREIRPGGSRAFINDSPVAINALREIGEFLVDLHGQHDHQQLLREEAHRPFLDAFADVAPHLERFRQAYDSVAAAARERDRLAADRRAFTEKLELYRLHARDIDAAKLTDEEEDRLRTEMKMLDAAEDLARTTAEILDAGSEGDPNVLAQLRKMAGGLERLSEFDPDLGSYAGEVKAALISLSEMLNQVERFKSTLSFNPKKLESLRERLSDLKALQRRFNRSIPELLAYRREIAGFLAGGDSFEDRLAELDRTLDARKAVLNDAAGALTQARRLRAAQLEAGIADVLAGVGIPNAVFQVDFQEKEDSNGWIARSGRTVEATPYGAETIRFLISTNRGEQPKPLARIASGGEISRVMLALKSIVAREQALPVMVFDEIDTGISGAVSEKVGRVMRRLSRTCQILTITHQAQIACQADAHYRVEKTERDDRTITGIRRLDAGEQVEELARLISGEVVSAAALENARSLIERARDSGGSQP